MRYLEVPRAEGPSLFLPLEDVVFSRGPAWSMEFRRELQREWYRIAMGTPGVGVEGAVDIWEAGRPL